MGKTFRGQGLVEFALILPVLLLTLFVLVELARVLHAWLAVENGARSGVRYAVTAEYNPDYCPPGGCFTDTEKRTARLASIHDAAWAGSSSIVRVGFGEAAPDEKSYFDVIVCDPDSLVLPASTFDTHACPSGEDPGEPGEPVVVVVEFNHPLLTPLLSTVWPELRLTAKREAKVETYRLPLAAGTAPAFDSPTPKPTNTPGPTSTQSEPQPVVELCGHNDLFFKGSYIINDSTGYSSWLKERHGWEDGVVEVAQVIISNVIVVQNGDILEVDYLRVGNAGSPQYINVGEDGREVSVPMNVELALVCSGTGCSWYREGLVEINFDGTMSGSYSAITTVYFPEFNTSCDREFSVNTSYVPPATSTYTPGPSPTQGQVVPTNTPYEVPSATPKTPEAEDTPDAPSD